MGLLDFLNGGQAGPSASPGTQGLLTLSQALLQAGQPSRIPVNAAQAFGPALLAGSSAYRTASDRQSFMNALQKGDTAGAVKTLVSSSDPELQKAGLSAMTATMIPKWEATKDAMGNPIVYNATNPSQTMPIGRSPFAALGLDGSPPPGSPVVPGAVPPGAPSPAGAPAPVISPSGAPGATAPMNTPQASPPAAAPSMNAAPPQKPGVDYNYLNQVKALSPLAGTMAENMIAGTFNPESGKGENDPNYVAAIAIARRADPSFTPQSLIGRPGMVKNASSGNMYQLATSLNTGMAHLYDLHAMAPLTMNAPASSPAVNWIGKYENEALGGPAYANNSRYSSTLNTAAPEIAKYLGGGVATDTGTAEARGNFSENQPPDVIQKNATDLGAKMMAKGGSLQNEYDSTMGNAGSYKVVKPMTEALYADMQGKPLTPDQQQLVNQHRAESNLPPKTWGNQPPATQQSAAKIATMADVQTAALKSGKTVAQVMKDAQAKGYVIQ